MFVSNIGFNSILTVISMNRFTILFLLLIGLCSCKQGGRAQSASSIPTRTSWVNATPTIHSDSIRSLIRTHHLPTTETAVWDSVTTAYYAGNHALLWMEPHHRAQIDTLLYWLDTAWKHGLDPEMLGRTTIKTLVHQMEQEPTAGQTADTSLARLEHLLTQSYMHYVCGMHYGFLRPDMLSIHGTDASSGRGAKEAIYHIPFEECTWAYATQALNSLEKGTMGETLRAVQPASLYYTKMQKEVEKYAPLAHKHFEAIPEMGNLSLKKGESHKAIPLITRRLLLTGEVMPQQVDTLSEVLTPELLQGINEFRIHNRLPEDSVLGTFTIRYLNNPMSYYADRLRVNLERARWRYAQPKGEKYVMVNTAAFMLQAINEETNSVLEMRICCGKPQNKTPLLSSEIFYMDLNPYWNVPQSIIKKEMIPAYMRDTTYFTKHRMKLYDNKGNELNPHDIEWSNRNRSSVSVRQDNREGNSLGRIIFRFPNSFAVYLHDTPAKAAFRRVNRAISHGCVRLEKPMDFASFLLDKPDEMLEDRIRVAMGLPALTDKGKKMMDDDNYKELEAYTLKKKVPLFIDYQTVYLSPDQQLSYCEDTYKYDKAVLAAFEQLNKQYGTNE